MGFLGSFWEGASSFGGRRARGERARGGFRTRRGGLGRTPRVHAGLAHVSTIHRSRSRLSSRVTRREERGLVRGLAKNPPFPRGLFLLPAEGWVARGLEGDAADRTAAGIPRDEGRKDRRDEVRGGGVRFGWVEERRRALNVCEGSSWSHAAFSKCAAGARRVDAGILNGTGVDRRDATGRPRDEDRRERGHLATFLTPRNLRVFWHPSQRDEFSVQFPPHASNRRGGASDVSRWPRGMDTTHPTAHENASIVPRGTLPTRPRPAPSRSDGRRSRGCPATTH